MLIPHVPASAIPGRVRSSPAKFSARRKRDQAAVYAAVTLTSLSALRYNTSDDHELSARSCSVLKFVTRCFIISRQRVVVRSGYATNYDLTGIVQVQRTKCQTCD
jgi:hypothetical protein